MYGAAYIKQKTSTFRGTKVRKPKDKLYDTRGWNKQDKPFLWT